MSMVRECERKRGVLKDTKIEKENQRKVDVEKSLKSLRDQDD